MRSLGLKSEGEWIEYCTSGKKPPDIPNAPRQVYSKLGWAGMGDWLGTGRLANKQPFNQARAFVRGLGLKSRKEWDKYCKSGNKPRDIPNAPDQVYRDAGWISWGHWLGTGNVATHHRRYRPFNQARAFVRGLGLKSGKEWDEYCKSGNKPRDIPNAPQAHYEEVGWAGMGDWLGTGSVSNQLRKFRSFKGARAFVRRLGMKSAEDWRYYCKSGTKPSDIPTNPNVTYAQLGWAGFANWLGNDIRERR